MNEWVHQMEGKIIEEEVKELRGCCMGRIGELPSYDGIGLRRDIRDMEQKSLNNQRQ